MMGIQRIDSTGQLLQTQQLSSKEGHAGVSLLLETGRLAEAEDPIPMQL